MLSVELSLSIVLLNKQDDSERVFTAVVQLFTAVVQFLKKRAGVQRPSFKTSEMIVLLSDT